MRSAKGMVAVFACMGGVMTGTEILGLVTGAYDVLKSVSLRICDLFAMDKVDQTKVAELKAEYEKAALNFDF